jgi:hypothetical protein
MAVFQWTFDADGDSDEFIADGYFNVIQSGTYGGGTVSLSVKNDTLGTFTVLNDADATEAAQKEILMDGFNVYKLSLAGATAPDITVEIYGNSVRKNTTTV